MKNNKE